MDDDDGHKKGEEVEEMRGDAHGGMGQCVEPGGGGKGHLLEDNHDSSQVPVEQKSMGHHKRGDRNRHLTVESLTQVHKVPLT